MSLVEQEEESIGFFAYLIAVLGNIVALDGDFANLKEFRNFRRLGWLANGLCAVFCGWLAQSWTVFLVGILVFFSFWLCIRLVKPFMAIAVGLAIAAYWGWFGFFLTKWLLTYPLFSTLPPLQIMVGIFFTISAIIHITYIVRRLES